MTNKDVIIARLLRQNKQQADQIRLLTEENQKLRERIAHLEKNSSNSSKPPSSDIINPKPPAKNGRKRKRGGQLGHKKYSRQPFTPEQIDNTIIHELLSDEVDRRNLKSHWIKPNLSFSRSICRRNSMRSLTIEFAYTKLQTELSSRPNCLKRFAKKVCLPRQWQRLSVTSKLAVTWAIQLLQDYLMML